MMRLSLFLVSSLALLSTHPLAQGANQQEPLGAEDFGAQDSIVHIPQPMVFDMVRGLGAHRGELEINVLGQFPIRSSDSRATVWAPEIEGAILDGLALVLEFPFEGNELEAYKVAAQWTFGTAFENQFIHGTQFLVERFRHEEVWELTFLYMPGIRFDETWSALMMVGFRTEVGKDSSEENEVLFNLSIFADLNSSISAGVETNYAASLEGEGSFLAMPQVHMELTDHFMIQGGIGVQFLSTDSFPEAALRVICNFLDWPACSCHLS
jgi:hypothetical protein